VSLRYSSCIKPLKKTFRRETCPFLRRWHEFCGYYCEFMNVLFGQIAFPAIFLIVGTLNHRNLAMKGVCIVLAYFSLILLNGGMNAGQGMIDKSSSPFGIFLLGISLWGFVLVGSGARKSEKEDNSR